MNTRILNSNKFVAKGFSGPSRQTLKINNFNENFLFTTIICSIYTTRYAGTLLWGKRNLSALCTRLKINCVVNENIELGKHFSQGFECNKL